MARSNKVTWPVDYRKDDRCGLLTELFIDREYLSRNTRNTGRLAIIDSADFTGAAGKMAQCSWHKREKYHVAPVLFCPASNISRIKCSWLSIHNNFVH